MASGGLGSLYLARRVEEEGDPLAKDVVLKVPQDPSDLSAHVPEEELPVQATVSVHYGFDDSEMDSVRGLTIVPAMTAGIGDRVGSLAPGKDADLLVVTGDPIDPRNVIQKVYIEGEHVYDASRDGRRW